jgi:hypothetical protein
LNDEYENFCDSGQANICLAYLKAICAMTDTKPTHATLYHNPETDVVIIYRQNKKGTIFSRKFVFDKVERIFFTASLAETFPDMELIEIKAK